MFTLDDEAAIMRSDFVSTNKSTWNFYHPFPGCHDPIFVAPPPEYSINCKHR